MSILVTGGGGPTGTGFKKVFGESILCPGKKELDITNVYSINKYCNELQTTVDTVVLNASIEVVDVLEDWFTPDEMLKKMHIHEWGKSPFGLIYGNIFLIKKLHSINKLKSIYYITTHKDGTFPMYRVIKHAGEKIIQALTHSEEFKNTQYKIIKPLHMETQDQYDKLGAAFKNYIETTTNINHTSLQVQLNYESGEATLIPVYE